MKFCPQCKLPEGSECSLESLPGFVCPEPVEETKDTIVIHCPACAFTRGIQVGDLIKGLAGPAALPRCRRDVCQAVVIRPEAPEAHALFEEKPKAKSHKAAPKGPEA